MFIPAPGGGGTNMAELSGLRWAWSNMQWELRINEPERYARLLGDAAWYAQEFR